MKFTEIESPINGTKVICRENEDGSLSFIPMDESNSDYQAYLASLEKPTAKK